MTSDVLTTARWTRRAGLVLIGFAIASSSLTFSWIIDHDPSLNFYPEFAGRVIYLSDLLLLIGTVVWTAGWSLQGRPSLRVGPRYVAVPLVILMALTALSIAWADYPAQTGFNTARRALLFVMYIILASEDDAALPLIAVPVMLFAAVHAGVSWAQVLEGSALGLISLGEIDRSALLYPNIGCPRAFGLGFNPNPVAAFMGVSSTVACVLYLLLDQGRAAKTAVVVVLQLCLLGLVLTMSRAAFVGAILGMFAVAALALSWERARRMILFRRSAVVAAMVALTIQLYPAVAPLAAHCGVRPSRYSSDEVTETANNRLRDYSLALPVIRDHPWLGVGAANYPITLGKRLGIRDAVPVHNVPLLLLVELGILGLFSWLAIMCAPLVWAWSHRSSGTANVGGLVWLAPLVLLLFNGLLDFPFWATQDGRVIMMAVLGLWASSIQRDKKPISAP